MVQNQEHEIDTQIHMIKGERTERRPCLNGNLFETLSCCCSCCKGKRTKRKTPLFLFSLTDDNTTTSTTTSVSTEEEEDMANCLILLAQGHTQKPLVTRYECKTCNRRFHSFQALGGHRASHKKPKLNSSDDHKDSLFTITQEEISLSLQISNSIDSSFLPIGKQKVHECSVCGAEFSSGQALGGHMRRHRPISGAGASTAVVGGGGRKRAVGFAMLDLNLPAPEEEVEENFVSGSNKKRLIFGSACTSSLVDCRY